MIGMYCRVSTKDQNTRSQRAELEHYLKSNGIAAESVTWYEDHETGTTLKRPAFERLQRDIFTGKVKTVIIWKLDRLSRRLRDGVNLLADWTEKNVRIVVVTQQLDLSGPIGRMIAAVMLGLAEIELEGIRERQKAGIALARQRGAYKGRKPGARKASPERARELRDKGNTVAEIATALKTSERTVARYLKPTQQEDSMIRIKTLKAMRPNSLRFSQTEPEPINPFQQDAFHMGQTIGKNVSIMFREHSNKDQPYIIVINTRTGERVGIEFTEESAWPNLATQFALPMPVEASITEEPDVDDSLEGMPNYGA